MGDGAECLDGLRKEEGVEHRDRAIELSLRIGAARDREMDATEMFADRVTGMFRLRLGRCAQQRHASADNQRSLSEACAHISSCEALPYG